MARAAVVLDEATHAYTVDGRRVPGVTEIIGANGFYEFPFTSPADLSYKMMLGHHVHKACELYDLGTLDWSTVREEVGAYVQGYVAFRSDHPDWLVLENERLIYHRVLDFAGTLDRIYRIDALRTLVDIKIGVDLPAARLQSAAYAAAYNLAEDNRLDRLRSRRSLHLRSNGSYHLVAHEGAQDFRAFCACLQLYHWKRNGRK
jgi:hypothetical protein